jgi:hypothetical protein
MSWSRAAINLRAQSASGLATTTGVLVLPRTKSRGIRRERSVVQGSGTSAYTARSLTRPIIRSSNTRPRASLLASTKTGCFLLLRRGSTKPPCSSHLTNLSPVVLGTTKSTSREYLGGP